MYELKVHCDGNIAVRKIENEIPYGTNITLTDINAVKNYLAEWLSVSWPMQEVIQDIQNASLNQWVEFK